MEGTMDTDLQRAAPLYQQIYHLLRRQILQGRYKPGESVYESRIATDLRVSRTPVREALRQLEREGLVISNGSELMIANPTRDEFVELYTCRAALEHIVAERAAQLATDADLAAMTAALDDARAAMADDDHALVVAANTRFHDAMVSAARMVSLRQLMDTIRGPILVARRHVLAGSEAAEQEVWKEHTALLEAIRRHNPEEAQQLMATHMRNDTARGVARFESA